MKHTDHPLYRWMLEHPERWDASWRNERGNLMAAYSYGSNGQTTGFSRGWKGLGRVSRGGRFVKVGKGGPGDTVRCMYPPGSYRAVSWYAGREARRRRDKGIA